MNPGVPMLRKMIPALVIFSLQSPEAASGTDLQSQDSPLGKIETWLSSEDPNRQSLARQQLQDAIGPEEIAELGTHLRRQMPMRTRIIFEGRLKELVAGRLGILEEQVHEFEDARRECRNLSARQQGNPDDPELSERLQDARAERSARRQRVTETHRQIKELGLALAPALRERIEMGGQSSDLVERLRSRLFEESLRLAAKLADTELAWIDRRNIAPLLAELQRTPSIPFAQIEADLLVEALELIESYLPEFQRHGRRLLLDLSSAGQRGIEKWAALSENPLPDSERRRLVERNRLRVPPDFDIENALPIESYLSSDNAGRGDLIHRLRWVGGKSAAPVLAALLDLEDDLNLRVEAASALARLSDRRGPDFLRQLGIAEAVGIESTSRRVLVRAAVEKRDKGDPQGALEDLLALLRRLPGDFRLHYEIGLTSLRLRQLPLSIEHFQRALDLLPQDSNTLYNLACAHALAGNTDRALETLSAAFEEGFDDVNLARNDRDLESLRDDPRFERMLEEQGDR